MCGSFIVKSIRLVKNSLGPIANHDPLQCKKADFDNICKFFWAYYILCVLFSFPCAVIVSNWP